MTLAAPDGSGWLVIVGLIAMLLYAAWEISSVSIGNWFSDRLVDRGMHSALANILGIMLSMATGAVAIGGLLFAAKQLLL